LEQQNKCLYSFDCSVVASLLLAKFQPTMAATQLINQKCWQALTQAL
jgi:hypothetical protein